jgi:hypothetical protein
MDYGDPLRRICERVADLEHEMQRPTPKRLEAARMLGIPPTYFHRRKLGALYYALRVAAGID